MKKFWNNIAALKKPFFTLAPMEKAADTLFRQVISITSKPDVFFTEFTNVEGMFSKGKMIVERRLKFTQSERPLIAQIWGTNPEAFYKAALYLRELKFDGIDINMGCPESSITAKGACAALMNNKVLAAEIINAVAKGAGNLPVSVKTRIGFSKIQTTEWIGFILQQKIDALIIHARTRKEMSKVPAHWSEFGKAVKLRNQINKNIIIIGNGDIKSVSEGKLLAEKYGIEGVMIGRGVFEDAWVFAEKKFSPTIAERITILSKHLRLYQNEAGEKLPYNTLKKYFKIYIREFDGASELRSKLMESRNVSEANHIISEHILLI